ncbi:TPA: hypothetical protein ACGOVQ_001836 [Streptococcus suis]
MNLLENLPDQTLELTTGGGSVNWVVAGTQCLGAGTQCLGAGVIGLIGGPWTALGACVISGGRSITGDLLN